MITTKKLKKELIWNRDNARKKKKPPKLYLYPKEIKNFPSIKKDKAVIRKKKSFGEKDILKYVAEIKIQQG